jgi:hypothetical protein
MTPVERQRYVRWWIQKSGLTRHELRQMATALWTDRLMDDDFG